MVVRRIIMDDTDVKPEMLDVGNDYNNTLLCPLVGMYNAEISLDQLPLKFTESPSFRKFIGDIFTEAMFCSNPKSMIPVNDIGIITTWLKSQGIAFDIYKIHEDLHKIELSIWPEVNQARLRYSKPVGLTD